LKESTSSGTPTGGLPVYSIVTQSTTLPRDPKVKLSLYRPWRPLGLPEVEAPTISDIQLTDGGKVVRATRRPLFTPRKIPGTHSL
jgi:hypothetical protein